MILKQPGPTGTSAPPKLGVYTVPYSLQGKPEVAQLAVKAIQNEVRLLQGDDFPFVAHYNGGTMSPRDADSFKASYTIYMGKHADFFKRYQKVSNRENDVFLQYRDAIDAVNTSKRHDATEKQAMLARVHDYFKPRYDLIKGRYDKMIKAFRRMVKKMDDTPIPAEKILTSLKQGVFDVYTGHIRRFAPPGSGRIPRDAAAQTRVRISA